MLANTDLLASLNTLQGLYSAALGQPAAEQKRICKYALLELCGWVEEAQDHILHACTAKLSDPDLIAIINNRVKRTHGFHPDDHFLPMLGLVIGLHNYEIVRANLLLTTPLFQPAMQLLASLKVPRNTHAHTHFVGTNASALGLLNAPSILLADANTLNVGFTALENELVAAGFC